MSDEIDFQLKLINDHRVDPENDNRDVEVTVAGRRYSATRAAASRSFLSIVVLSAWPF